MTIAAIIRFALRWSAFAIAMGWLFLMFGYASALLHGVPLDGELIAAIAYATFMFAVFLVAFDKLRPASRRAAVARGFAIPLPPSNDRAAAGSRRVADRTSH